MGSVTQGWGRGSHHEEKLVNLLHLVSVSRAQPSWFVVKGLYYDELTGSSAITYQYTTNYEYWRTILNEQRDYF